MSADYRADVTGIFRGGQRAYFDSACLIYFRGFNKGELHISYEVANEVPIYQHDFECPINLYKIILCGDINVDPIKSKNDCNNLRNILNSYNMSQKIDQPTRVTPTTSSIVDNVFVNFTECDCSVVNFELSDHYGQIINIVTSEIKSQQKTITYKRIISIDKLRG